MPSFPNINKSAFRKGEYVGYSAGAVWRIRRSGRNWQALRRMTDGLALIPVGINQPTLTEISAKLTSIDYSVRKFGRY